MSGVSIIKQLLSTYAPLLAEVPAARIIAGTVQLGTPLPAIGIKEISCNEIATVARGSASVTQRSRVQVTVLTKSYADQKRILRLTRLGPGVHRGVILTYRVQNVIPLEVGPDLNNGDDDEIYEQSRDFMVTFAEAS